eukprot:Sspe_Gene.106085::Locus_83280_Transcript_2_2_Confidence_0.667_Length_1119::g.106085::m.106085
MTDSSPGPMPEQRTIFRRRANATEDLFQLPSAAYLKRFNVQCYLNDAVHQLLECRDDRPLEFIAEYFMTVTKGTHVVQRSYAFVMATHHNRTSFCTMLQLCFGEETPMTTPEDVHQSILLLCPDFPFHVVDTVYKHLSSVDDALSFRAMLSAVCVHICFMEYLFDLYEAFHSYGGAMTAQMILNHSIEYSHKGDEISETRFYGTQPPRACPAPVLDTLLRDLTKDGQTAEVPLHHILTLVICAAISMASVTAGLVLPEPSEVVHRSGAVTYAALATELYQSSELLAMTQLPEVGGLEQLADSIFRAHDSMVNSGRRRRHKGSKRSPLPRSDGA